MCRACAAPHRGLSSRRALLLAAAAGIAGPAVAQVEVRRESAFRRLVPVEAHEAEGAAQYRQAVRTGRLPDDHPQVRQLRAIAARMLPFAARWNPRAPQWEWEIHLIASREVDAFCLPGGKIAFYQGMLDELQLTEDEIAFVMGHEMAHAAREHLRAQLGRTAAMRIGLAQGADTLGVAPEAAGKIVDMGVALLALRFSRDDEHDADLVGLEIAARAGFDPAGGIAWLRKVERLRLAGVAQRFLDTHPTHAERMRMLEVNLPKVQGLGRPGG